MHAQKAQVVLIHGLGRSSKAMLALQWSLRKAGYQVYNFGYPSQHLRIQEAADDWLRPALAKLKIEPGQKVNFVTHSLGGLVFRAWADQRESTFPLGRTVMLAPPNKGSEIMDHLKDQAWAHWLFGPVVKELGIGPKGTAQQLGPAPAETHIIMGKRSLLPLFTHLLGPESDGIVSVSSGHLQGETSFTVLDADHTTIMWRPTVMSQIKAIFSKK